MQESKGNDGNSETRKVKHEKWQKHETNTATTATRKTYELGGVTSIESAGDESMSGPERFEGEDGSGELDVR